MELTVENILNKIYTNTLKGEYAKLPLQESILIREYYKSRIPCHIPLNGGNASIRSYEGTLISNKYDRIVIGDYGAYIEISKDDVIKSNLKVAEGQEYRLQPKYSNVKYLWFTTKDNSGVKIYYQKNTVSYADYKVGFIYVDPKGVYMTMEES